MGRPREGRRLRYVTDLVVHDGSRLHARACTSTTIPSNGAYIKLPTVEIVTRGRVSRKQSLLVTRACPSRTESAILINSSS